MYALALLPGNVDLLHCQLSYCNDCLYEPDSALWFVQMDYLFTATVKREDGLFLVYHLRFRSLVHI